MSAGLERFVAAQDAHWNAILAELTEGRKATHWMWYVFPQLGALGHSAMAKRYGIDDLEEARRFHAHPTLGRRLQTCMDLVLEADAPSAEDIFGPIDAKKLRSCATLFDLVKPDDVFGRVLTRYFPEGPDPATCDLLRG
ncbi:MAG: DUF1810 domain-containing protein [Pseudomonadota bacterium]